MCYWHKLATSKTAEPQTHRGMARPSPWGEVQRPSKASLGWEKCKYWQYVKNMSPPPSHPMSVAWRLLLQRMFLLRLANLIHSMQPCAMNPVSVYLYAIIPSPCSAVYNNPTSLFNCINTLGFQGAVVSPAKSPDHLVFCLCLCLCLSFLHLLTISVRSIPRAMLDVASLIFSISGYSILLSRFMNLTTVVLHMNQSCSAGFTWHNQRSSRL